MEIEQYLDIFISESQEHLQSMNENLLKLEENPQDLVIVNEVFRSAHTLKGMSATMGFQHMSELTHQMENVLDGLRNEKYQVTAELLDVIFNALDLIEEMVDSIINGGSGEADIQQCINELRAIETGQAIAEVAATSTTTEVKKSGFNLSDYNEYELTIITQALEQNFKVYVINVQLDQESILKAARAYMVFNALEGSGEIIHSNPSVDLLEDESFDGNFTILYVTEKEADLIKTDISNISEVEKVDIESIKESDILETQKVEEETPAEKPKAQQAEPQQATKKQPVQANQTIRVHLEKLNLLMNLFEELIVDRGRLEQLAREIDQPALTETVEKITRVSSSLQSVVLNLRMVPVDTVFNRFPKMVRQLARELNKKIKLQIEGKETELDRTLIDEIGDPLIHILRNSVDHGIENPDVRKQKGKSEEGTILLKAYQSGNHVMIEISDDGAGINSDKVLKKAIEKGVIGQEEAEKLTENDINQLILAPGFSTAEKVSNISGRGVGLDVVKNTIESLGGSVIIHSAQDKGTTFTIQLPLTLSIIRVMLVSVQEEIYAIPITSIVENIEIHKDQIELAYDQKVIMFRGKVVPLLFLSKLFGLDADENSEDLSVVIIQKGDQMAGLVVNDFIGQQEVVLKSLGNYLKDVYAISGATILGNGQVALVIDTNELIK